MQQIKIYFIFIGINTRKVFNFILHYDVRVHFDSHFYYLDKVTNASHILIPI